MTEPHAPPRVGPGVAGFAASGLKREEERSEALQVGRDPDEPASKPLDWLDQELREGHSQPAAASSGANLAGRLNPAGTHF
ncbi:MAG: hypothetical protein QOJ29_2385 [Thermoleophilaceae bacterium]|nr:hypothetical protein [Thermoleophilaceae bacterium]